MLLSIKFMLLLTSYSEYPYISMYRCETDKYRQRVYWNNFFATFKTHKWSFCCEQIWDELARRRDSFLHSFSDSMGNIFLSQYFVSTSSACKLMLVYISFSRAFLMITYVCAVTKLKQSLSVHGTSRRHLPTLWSCPWRTIALWSSRRWWLVTCAPSWETNYSPSLLKTSALSSCLLQR